MSKSRATSQTSASSPTSPTTSVVVPTLNEEENLPQLIEEIHDTFQQDGMREYRPFEVIFVDGGSTDGTRELIRDTAREQYAVRGLFLKRRFGQSPALAAGFDHAHGEFIAPMDGDLQNDPRDLPRLLEKLQEGYDCVSGWRRDRNDPWHKTIPSRIQTTLAKATGPQIHDFGCTLKVYHREALADIDLYGEGHRYIPAKLHKLGYSVTELEVNHRPREHGQSRYGVSRLLRGFVDLLFHWFWNRYSTRPLHFLGTLSFVMMSMGGLVGTISLLQRYVFGVPLDPRTPRLILAGLLITVGFQMLIFGVLAEMLTKLHYRDDTEYRVERRVDGGAR